MNLLKCPCCGFVQQPYQDGSECAACRAKLVRPVDPVELCRELAGPLREIIRRYKPGFTQIPACITQGEAALAKLRNVNDSPT